MKYFTQQVSISDIYRNKLGIIRPAAVTGYLLDAPASAVEEKQAAVIICPGGGYEHSSEREAEAVAVQFLGMGYHAFFLQCSVRPTVLPAALMELAFLTAMTHDNREQWLVDEHEIIICGFSAGGHLACSLGALRNQSFLCEALGRSPQGIRSDGMILAYPVITSEPSRHEGSVRNFLGERVDAEEARHQISLEYQVGEQTPKAFIWHTVTDSSVPVKNSLLLLEALISHGVNVELHIFPTGRYGLSLANREISGGESRYIEPQCQSWISLVRAWLECF